MESFYVYEQSTGRFLRYERGSAGLVGRGYSGSLCRNAVNDHYKQWVRSVGPIPVGLYDIGPPRSTPTVLSYPLRPDGANEMRGRDGFLLHGDSADAPGDGSEGCIVLGLEARADVLASGIRRLVVGRRLTDTFALVRTRAAGGGSGGPCRPHHPLCRT